MKKNLQMMITLAAFGVLLAFASSICAQKKPMMVGGYKAVAVTDPGVVEAAIFAIGDHSQKNDVSLEIVEIQQAERQVVAGTNYRMCVEVKVSDEGNDDTQLVKMVVYKDLQKKYKVTSWEADACGSKLVALPIAGGYKSVAVNDKDITEAADFAVSDHSQKSDVSLEIVRIQKAERQVVAGMNYQMCIEVKVTEKGNPDTQFVQAVVYRNLQNEFSLTSWKPDVCGKK